MRAWKRIALVLVAPAILGLAGTARADATIDGDVVVAIQKGKKFVVEADVTMSNPGVVTLTGTLGATPVSLTKKFKTKAGKARSKTIKFAVDPKKLGLREVDDTLVLQVSVDAAENGQAEAATANGGAALPPPLMIIPGTGNETVRGFYELFRDALNEQAGSPWLTRGKRASIKIVNYNSLSIGLIPRQALGQVVAKATARVIKRSIFTRADIVCHSMGGFIVREAMLPSVAGKKGPVSLAGSVRNVFFMGVAQSGTPVSYLAKVAIDAANLAGVDPADIAEPLLAQVDNPTVASLADLLLNPAFFGVVEAFYPTYPFASVPNPLTGGVLEVDLATLTAIPGPSLTAPLSALNAAAPDPLAVYHALNYTDVAGATGDLRTLGGVDLVAFLIGGGADLSAVGLVNGSGDGVAPWTSAIMDAHPTWNAVLVPVDLGSGLHTVDAANPTTPAYWNDPQVFGYILGTVLGIKRK